MTTTTFPQILARLLGGDAGRPLVTYYDHRTGERVELSVATYGNWVAKASSLLVEEHDLERGRTLAVDLPPHWLGTVFLGAAWNVGLQVVPGDAADAPDAVVCGPDSLGRWADHAGRMPVLACSLHPLGVRFADPLPADVHDVGVEIWSQPDAWTPWDPPQPDDLAIDGTSQAELWSVAAAGELVAGGGRLLSVANPASPPAVATFSEPLVKGGSLVLVANADPERLGATYAAERATARFP